jgi:CheY-like chemotaxis protein
MANQTEMDLRPLVLIIDSEEAVRDLYGKWFISLGFQVMCAVGTLGLSCALRRERPQLIITELHAKDLTLHGLFARLRSEQSTRCIPVIVLTTCCDDEILDEAKRLGAAVVLPKFAPFEALRSWVQALCPETMAASRGLPVVRSDG